VSRKTRRTVRVRRGAGCGAAVAVLLRLRRRHSRRAQRAAVGVPRVAGRGGGPVERRVLRHQRRAICRKWRAARIWRPAAAPAQRAGGVVATAAAAERQLELQRCWVER
jgi:hypothetical protein